MKEQIKAPEKELSNKDIANLSDAKFKTLVIKMLTALTELGQNMKEQMKSTQMEIKQNIQGTNSDRKETGTQINDLEQKEEIAIQPEQPYWDPQTKKQGPNERTEQNFRKRAKQ